MTELLVDYDTDVFIDVPLSYPIEAFDTPEQWAAAAASAVLPAEGEGGYGVSPLGEGEWRELLLECAQLGLTSTEPLLHLLLHIPDVKSFPLPVFVCLNAPDDPIGLTDLVAVDRPGAVETPIVESFETEALGVGLRTLRYTAGDEGTLAATLRYGFLVEGIGPFLVWTSTSQLGRLHDSMDDLDALLLSVVRE